MLINTLNLKDIAFTRTTKYLFPLLYDGNIVVPSALTNLEENGFKFINLYKGDLEKDYPENENLFMLLYISDFENDNFKMFFNLIQKHSLFQEYYNVDINLIMIVFKLNSDGKQILELFNAGAYSKFPDQYKSLFTGGMEKPLNCAYNVLYKHSLLRHDLEQKLDIKLNKDSELDDKPYDHQEFFRYD